VYRIGEIFIVRFILLLIISQLTKVQPCSLPSQKDFFFLIFVKSTVYPSCLFLLSLFTPPASLVLPFSVSLTLYRVLYIVNVNVYCTMYIDYMKSTELEFVNFFVRSPEIDSQPGGPVRQPYVKCLPTVGET
jgi:hypothetical protein